MIRIGAVQHPSTESLLENFEYISNYTINAKEAGCSCVCFPECSLTGYFPE
jgi:predicted amidohydrolase